MPDARLQLAIAQLLDEYEDLLENPPEEENYDDTESAYNNGMDVGVHELLVRLQGILNDNT